MLEPKEITLSLRQRYMEAAGDIQYSFYRFPCIFMAKDSAYLKYVEIDGAICILSLPPQGVAEAYSLFPLGAKNLALVVDTLEKELGITYYTCLTPSMVAALEDACPGKFEFEDNRADYDYIYDTQSMIELRGKKYHSKRNFISRFSKNYPYEYMELNASTIEECIPAMNEWFDTHPGYKSPNFDERLAIQTLMENFCELELRGGAIKVGKKIAAFTIGEYVAPDMAHIIIEKADTEYMGVYALINNEFLKREWADTTYVNREEDMGIEGLRKAKLSYHPVKFHEVSVGRVKGA